MKKLSIALFAIMMAVTFTSCTTVNKSMREANVRVELNKTDFNLSEQVSAEAVTTKYLGIDWSRLFTKNTGSIDGGSLGISLASIPVVGNMLTDKTSNYALYELMTKNPGFDVVFYPQYEVKVSRPLLGIGFLQKTTTVKATARLGKLK